ncbi:MAG: hypothetical protein ACRCTZ_03445 [Sarcina sp.]
MIVLYIGRNNEDWNTLAPHGVGRVLSEKRAKEQISLDKFRDSIKGIWTLSVSKDSLDESPMSDILLADIGEESMSL